MCFGFGVGGISGVGDGGFGFGDIGFGGGVGADSGVGVCFGGVYVAGVAGVFGWMMVALVVVLMELLV